MHAALSFKWCRLRGEWQGNDSRGKRKVTGKEVDARFLVANQANLSNQDAAMRRIDSPRYGELMELYAGARCLGRAMLGSRLACCVCRMKEQAR